MSTAVESICGIFSTLWCKKYVIDIQRSKELIQMDIKKMMTYGIFIILHDKHTQSDIEHNNLQSQANHWSNLTGSVINLGVSVIILLCTIKFKPSFPYNTLLTIKGDMRPIEFLKCDSGSIVQRTT